jgi:PAS domain S-box-containing protein
MSTPAHEENVQELRRQLEEAEETLRAIRSGEVDALVVEGPEGERVYTLQGADHPYRALIEAMQQGAASLSGDGTVLYCNRCLADMLKMPHERVIGAMVGDFLPSGERPGFTALLGQALTGSSHGELQFQAADGTLLPVYLALSPLPLPGTVALCLVVTDLTEQKKHQDLQETNRLKDEFLAMLAHELRNPLAPIRNAVAILHHLGPTDDRVVYSRDVIERQVQHLARLVDDLLDVSRITLGKVKLQKERVELAAVVTRAVETSRPAIDARRHRLTLSLPPRGVQVEADPTRLAQIISNLLTNAAKYTDEGGQVFLTAEREGAQVVIRVRDTGMGIPAELLTHVFDLFIQGDRTLDRSDGGLGIGLTLVRRLVEMHGGTVAATSAGPGQGSEFVVRLPALAALAAEEPIKDREVAREFESNGQVCRSVLVVEDNKDGADSLAQLLTLMGHQVRVAYTGPEALQAAKLLHPQVVLLDIGLPGMNGYEVAKRLRKLPGHETTVLVAMTGYGHEEDKQRSREAGFNHHLVKPVDLNVLQGLLEPLSAFPGERGV